MIKVKSIQFAQKALVDERSKLLSLINIIDIFRTKAFPFIVPEMAFVLRTEKDAADPNTAEFQVVIKQGDNTILQHSATLDYQDKLFNNLVVNINGLVFSDPAPLEVTVNLDSEHLANLKLAVEQIGGPEVVE